MTTINANGDWHFLGTIQVEGLASHKDMEAEGVVTLNSDVKLTAISAQTSAIGVPTTKPPSGFANVILELSTGKLFYYL